MDQDKNNDGVPDQLEIAKITSKSNDNAAALASQERIADQRAATEKYKADKDAEMAASKIRSSGGPVKK